MEVYSKEEIVNHIETCKKNGILDGGRLYQIQTAMRAGLSAGLLEALEDPMLTERQMQQIIGLAVNGFPEKELITISRVPEQFEQHRDAHYKSAYGEDRKKIYQEIFDTFQVQWQRNFDQLLKQTETLSNTLDFLKEQVKRKEQELNSAAGQIEELHIQISKEKERAQNLEQEKSRWEMHEDRAEPENGKEQPRKENREILQEIAAAPYEGKTCLPGKREEKEKAPTGGFLPALSIWKGKKEKNPEKKLIALIGSLDEGQMEQVLDGYEQGLSLEEIRSYAKPGYSTHQMQEMKKLLLKANKK